MDAAPTHTDIWMYHSDLARAPTFEWPQGYAMRAYHAGDIQTWVRVQAAADPDFPVSEATFAESMPGDTPYLAARVMFLVDPIGRDIGTITAWNDDVFNQRDIGRIHWVAIVREAQGQGLAKPMLGAACAALLARGYAEAWLWTHTSLSPAISLYCLFGFRPRPRNDAQRNAWNAAAARLKLPLAE